MAARRRIHLCLVAAPDGHRTEPIDPGSFPTPQDP
jgi:hypothetical protein